MAQACLARGDLRNYLAGEHACIPALDEHCHELNFSSSLSMSGFVLVVHKQKHLLGII